VGGGVAEDMWRYARETGFEGGEAGAEDAGVDFYARPDCCEGVLPCYVDGPGDHVEGLEAED